jgi:plastocyanin
MAGGANRGRPLWLLIVAVYVGFAIAAPAVIATRKARENDTGGGKTAAGGATATVVMAQIAYKPTGLSVRRGAEVTFDNKDVAPHTVTESNGPIDSGLLSPGKSFKVVVDRSFDYICTLHPSMKASISLSG